MTARLGRGWTIGGAAVLVLAAILIWAWIDGGERPIERLSAPAMLPQVTP